MAEEETAPTLDPRAVLLEEMWADPEFRPVLQEHIKKKHPTTTMPEHDARTIVRTELDAFRKERDEERKAREAERQHADLARARATAIEAGVDASEIADLEQFMRDNLIGDHAKAAKFFVATRETATPRSGPLQIPGSTGDDYYKGIFKDYAAWRKDKAHEFFDELASQRGRRR